MKNKVVAIFRITTVLIVIVFFAHIAFQVGTVPGAGKTVRPEGFVETIQPTFINLQNINTNRGLSLPSPDYFSQKIFSNETVVQVENPPLTVKALLNPSNQKFKVVLNPGHGYYFDTLQNNRVFQRPNIGGVIEDNLNIDLAIKLQQELNINQQIQGFSTRELNKSAGLHSSGYPLWQMSSLDNLMFKNLPEYIYNRDVSKFPYEPNFAKDLLSRGGYANYLLADALVGVHNNLGGGCGTEVWYDTKNGFGFTSSKLAQYINQKLITNGDYSETREFFGPAVIVEVGFMDNQSDRNSLISTVFQQIVAEGIAQGVADFVASRIVYSYQSVSLILIIRDGVDRTPIISKIAATFKDQLKIDADPESISLKTLNMLVFKPEINTNTDQLISLLGVFDPGIGGVSKNNGYKTTPS
jgi:N-acetylmuramoyl-L-alanine amidase